MSLEFEPNWNRERPEYVLQYGQYQQLLNLLKEDDVRQALKVACILYKEGPVGDMLRAAVNPQGERVVVEQGAHQEERSKDGAGLRRLQPFDRNPHRTLHFTLRHYKRNRNRGIAFHCYLSRNVRGQWGVTTISYFEDGVGLKLSQTGGRDFMNQLARNFILAHGYDD
jgi:hypothetical protein